jgi:hypothetical protein
VAILAKIFIFRSVVLPWDIDVSLEGPHLVERLEPVCQPVAHIKESVIGQPHAMRQLPDVLFRFGVVQSKLAQKRPILIQHRNSEVPTAMTVDNVNVAVLWIHIDG